MVWRRLKEEMFPRTRLWIAFTCSSGKRRVSIDLRHSEVEFTGFCFLGVC